MLLPHSTVQGLQGRQECMGVGGSGLFKTCTLKGSTHRKNKNITCRCIFSRPLLSHYSHAPFPCDVMCHAHPSPRRQEGQPGLRPLQGLCTA